MHPYIFRVRCGTSFSISGSREAKVTQQHWSGRSKLLQMQQGGVHRRDQVGGNVVSCSRLSLGKLRRNFWHATNFEVAPIRLF